MHHHHHHHHLLTHWLLNFLFDVPLEISAFCSYSFVGGRGLLSPDVLKYYYILPSIHCFRGEIWKTEANMFIIWSFDQSRECYIVHILHYVFLSDTGNVYP